MNEVEEWRDVEGWGGKYKVSKCAKIWNTFTDVEVSQVVTGIPQYKYVNLHLPGQKTKLVRVHRLVAMAFVEGRSDEFDVVDHIDRDKFNNVWTNLRWVDHSGNGKNTVGALFVDDLHIMDYCERFVDCKQAYSYIQPKLRSGLTIEECLERYGEYLKYGLRNKKVLWKGSMTYLMDISSTYNLDYESTSILKSKL